MLENQISVIKSSIDSVSAYMTQAKKGKRIAEISKKLNDLKDAPTTVLVCGEFKRGKSTFINALIGRNICPTDVEICTSVVSVIKYGAKEKATRIYGDFSNLKQEIVPFDNIEQYTVGTAEEIGNTICMELELPLDELKKGLIIIDTPGVGGLDPRHAMLTNYFLPQADVTLFMTDANEPLSTTELEFYRDKVLQYARHSAIIVNKSDLLKDKNSVEDFRKDTISKVSVFTQADADSLDVISVSAADCIREEEGLGNFPKVRDLISNLVCDYKAELLGGIRDDLSEQLDLVITPLQVQITQIESPNTNQIQHLSNKKDEISKKINDLSNSQSQFRILVNEKISSERQAILMKLNTVCNGLSTTEFKKMIKDPRATSDGKWLGQQIYDKIGEISSEFTLELNNAFERVASTKEIEGFFSYKAGKYQRQFIVKDVDLSVPIHKQIMAGMSGYGIAGASLMFLSGIGLIAGLGTAIYVAKRHMEEVGDGMKHMELRDTYLPQIQTETQNLRVFVDGCFNDFQMKLFQTIAAKAKEYQDSISEAINEIQKLKQEINIAVSKKVSLQNQLNPLVNAKKVIDELDI